MKRINLILITLLILSCSKDDSINDCNCTRYNYEVQWMPNQEGTSMVQSDVFVGSQDVPCQDEVYKADFNGVTFHNIKCD